MGPERKAIKDQLGREMEISVPCRRIVSVVPSQTELLYDLGAWDQVAGVTRFCVHPRQETLKKEKVGGTKKLNASKIQGLDPDLILGNMEENNKEQIEELERQYPVWLSDVRTIPDALSMIRSVGSLTGKMEEAEGIAQRIDEDFRELDRVVGERKGPPKRVAYFIWKDPYMVVGSDTFIDRMLRRCGWVNAFSREEFPDIRTREEAPDYSGRYPQVSLGDIEWAAPDLLLLSSEPFPFREKKHGPEFRSILPGAEVRVVDGEMFSWYGSRLLQAPAYFRELLSSLSEAAF